MELGCGLQATGFLLRLVAVVIAPLLVHPVIDHMDFYSCFITCVPALTVPCPAALRTVSCLYKTGHIRSFLKPFEDSPLFSNTQNPSGGLAAPVPSSALARLAHTFPFL